MPRQGVGHEIGLPGRRRTSEADEENAATGPLLPENQLAEILVGSDQESAFLAGHPEDQLIANPRIELSDVQNVMTIPAKAVDDLPIDTLVSDELQAAPSGNG